MSIRHALLALLSEGPKYGFQLRQEFEATTGEAWPLNVGQVYTTLQRLERDGLVEADDDANAEAEGPQKRVRVTGAGEAELAAWLRTPPDMGAPPRDQLTIKVLVALHLPGVDVAGLVQSHRRYLVGLVQQYTRVREDAGDADVSLALVADAELFRLDAVIRWLDTVDGHLRRADVVLPLRPTPELQARRHQHRHILDRSILPRVPAG